MSFNWSNNALVNRLQVCLNTEKCELLAQISQPNAKRYKIKICFSKTPKIAFVRFKWIDLAL